MNIPKLSRDDPLLRGVVIEANGPEAVNLWAKGSHGEAHAVVCIHGFLATKAEVPVYIQCRSGYGISDSTSSTKLTTDEARSLGLALLRAAMIVDTMLEEGK